nr:inositol monophosphatase family protein [Conchiformibius kuhniae]
MLEQLQTLIRTTAENEIMPHFLRAEGLRKADGSALSVADLAAQAALERGLPSIIAAPVLGEEMPAPRQRELWQQAQTGLWVADPIDGTSNFINGIPHFAVSVAYVERGLPQFGAVYNPATGEMFAAARGHGATLNGTPLPLRQSPDKLNRAVAGVEVKRLRSGNLSSRIHTLSPVRTIRSMGSSTLDWCYLAAGRYDVYVHGGQNLWDYAAGALIFQEAGGQLATLEGDEFWSGKHAFQRSAIAALRRELFAAWLKWIRENQ